MADDGMRGGLIERQAAEIAMLRERIRQLEDALCPSAVRIPIEFRLTDAEARVFAHLASRDVASKESTMLAIYSDRPDDGPDPKIVNVFVCKMRRKLEPFGVVIETIWGQGWALRNRRDFEVRHG